MCYIAMPYFPSHRFFVLHCTRWGILHTEKFWRENAKFVEHDNFKSLKTLINHLGAKDPVRCVVDVFACVLCRMHHVGSWSNDLLSFIAKHHQE